MRAALAHRGPDEVGEYFDEAILLGATRLSIRDPSGGQQPARGCRLDLRLIYNGELYNHRELREDLLRRDHPLLDHADTTLLPHLYEEHGPAMVERLRGMFAFALWDVEARSLLLARDRLGIKPLYYAEADGLFLFASEMKAIFASGLVKAAIDFAAVDDLFSLSYPCPPRTMFKRVLELRPGHILQIDAGSAPGPPKRYWRAPFPQAGEHHRGSHRDLEAELGERLRTVVGEHLVSDVPVGAYLSGGLDSSAIASLAREAIGAPPQMFTIGFSDPRFDEREHARRMAEALGGPIEEIVIGPAAAELYPGVIRHLELPLHVPGAIAALVLAESARARGVPVVLTGDGADEIFGGYDCFRGDKIRRLFDRTGLRPMLPILYRSLYRWAGLPRGAVDWLLEVQARPSREIEEAFGGLRPPWYETWQAFADRDRLLRAGERPVRSALVPPPELLALVPEHSERLDPLDAALAFEIETRLPAWILVISDRSAMAHGVEARVPFLDHGLVEWICALPPELKMRRFQEKAALRAAMRGRLPEPIRKRKKRPFVTPLKEWFFGEARPEYVRERLSLDALRKAGIFDPGVVAELDRRLALAPGDHFDKMRLELTMMLVLGVQLLDHAFVRT